MTRAEDTGSGSPGASTPSGTDASASAVFADLASPIGPLEAVERLRALETLSYGVLYEGRVFQASRSEPISLLEIDPALEENREVLGRLLAELLATSRLRDSNVLSPRGVFRHGESLYVLFDAVAGVNLATAFDFLGSSGLRLSSEAILRVAGSVLAALDAARRESEEAEASHGLLTPENVFVAEGQRVLVRGFGLWPAGISRTRLLGLTERRYLAPSQNRSGIASPRTDLLSLGMMLFEAVLGFPAFDAPPEEEDLAELRVSVDELKEKADPSLRGLFEMIVSCLSPPASVTSAYRGRLRTTIDTLFLREFSRDRVAKTLSLEELVGRIKPRRPAIVKATPLSLAPAEVEPPVSAAPEEPAKPLVTGSVDPATSAALVRRPSWAPGPSEPPPLAPANPTWGPRVSPPGRWRISSTIWAFAATAVALGALAAIFWAALPGGQRASQKTTPTAEDRYVSLPVAPSPAAVIQPVIPSPAAQLLPSPAATAASAGRTERPSSLQASAAGSRRAGGERSPARREAPRERARRAPIAAIVPERPSAPSAPEPTVAVSAGSLVPWGTRGLVRPALIENPPIPRYGEADPRPAAEHSVLLEILINDQGRVRGSRILRADRLPPAGGLERYLAALRFRPAELAGIPVKVWMPYEVRFLAP